MPNLLKLLCQELRESRTAFPLVVGLVFSAAPILDPIRGWRPWPDLLYQAMTAYLVVHLVHRVLKVRQHHMDALKR
jgi:hypothetical protein